jgi:hypothetical protein
VFDQVYAKYQHERLDLRHPNGGKARYLADPLYEGHGKYYAEVVAELFTGGAVAAMTKAVESWNDAVKGQTPVDLNNLRMSGTRTVWDNGALASLHPAEQGRLSEAALRALKRYRRRR